LSVAGQFVRCWSVCPLLVSLSVVGQFDRC